MRRGIKRRHAVDALFDEALDPSSWERIKGDMRRRSAPVVDDDRKRMNDAARIVVSLLAMRGNPEVDMANKAWLKDSYVVAMRRARVDITAENMLTLHRLTAAMMGIRLQEALLREYVSSCLRG